jgi:hypothetical protein
MATINNFVHATGRHPGVDWTPDLRGHMTS